MNNSQSWVELAVKVLSCSQKDLARRIAVSQTQISKWKSGEYMSSEMEDKFRLLVKVNDMSPEFVLWAGSLDNAKKWERLIASLAEAAQESAETGYDVDPLEQELELLCAEVTDTLREMGISPPESFPQELDPYFSDEIAQTMRKISRDLTSFGICLTIIHTQRLYAPSSTPWQMYGPSMLHTWTVLRKMTRACTTLQPIFMPAL